jgi:hypothetical protein
MCHPKRILQLTTALVVCGLGQIAPAAKRIAVADEDGVRITGKGLPVLWRSPEGIGARNLFYGPGGESDQPHGPFVFIKEDLEGSNPKFVVVDRDAVKWKVKLGVEARPETAASRLVWAVGYAADEDYFLPTLGVEGMPARLQRGKRYVSPDGSTRNARLKRYVADEKKIGTWEWSNSPFTGTRELNGLRVMMALINNWDLKDENNAIYQKKSPVPEQIYRVSDLGASFGTTGFSWTRAESKGNLESYRHSQFIARVTAGYVDFKTPSRPALDHAPEISSFNARRRLRWIGQEIPRADVRWIAGILARLSPDQIRDAFRAAGYSREEVEGFSKVVESRIAELRGL